MGGDISSTADWDFSARTLHYKNLIYRKILYHGKAKRVMMCVCVCVYMFLCHCGVNACMFYFMKRLCLCTVCILFSLF